MPSNELRIPNISKESCLRIASNCIDIFGVVVNPSIGIYLGRWNKFFGRKDFR